MNDNWKKLKKSSNWMPTFDSLFPYILEVIKNGEETTVKVLKERLFKFLQIPEALLEQTYPNNPNLHILANRLSFSLSDLYKAGAVRRPRRGVYQITENGISLLQRYGEELTKSILEEQQEYIDYNKELEARNQKSESKLTVIEDTEEIEETQIDIKNLVANHNNEVAIELLNKIREVDHQFFEYLVVDLLDTMGYSGKQGDAQVTQKTNDGGIDGIINQDPLGTSTVYIQAKRYKEGNVIGRPAVQAFFGALAGINADRGVFITTSSYTKNAQEFAKNQGIVLIDGIQLTDLMLEYEVGVEKENEYITYRIDNDFFEMEE